MFRRRSAGVQDDTAHDPTDAESLAPETSTTAGGSAGRRGLSAIGKLALGRTGDRTGNGTAAGGTAGDKVDSGRGAGRSNGGPAEPAARRPAETGKGRPTPKRSEAERRRRRPITGAPRGASSKQYRSGNRADRNRVYEARKRGEEWALQPRDKGPVKALARDYVDSRRRIGEYYMWVLLALVVVMVFRVTFIAAIAEYVVLALILIVIAEGLLIRRSLHKLIAERLPGESTRGVTMYAVMRSLQIRRLRIPAPRVRPGDRI